jgi:Holliday junction resolvase-like predicted endonuclease
MKTTHAGLKAEARVAEFLKKSGYKILHNNWRTRACEIEVKFRSNEKQGDGFEYITPRKLKQMYFAAEIWNQQNNWNGDYRLMAAAVSEDTIKIIELN